MATDWTPEILAILGSDLSREEKWAQLRPLTLAQKQDDLRKEVEKEAAKHCDITNSSGTAKESAAESLFVSGDSSEDEAPDLVSDVPQAPLVENKKRPSDTPVQPEKPAKRPFAPAKKLVKKTTAPVTKQIVSSRPMKEVPVWYGHINRNKKFSRGDVASMSHIRVLIENAAKAVKEGGDMDGLITETRRKLHQAGLFDFVTDIIVKNSKVLEDGGLVSIFDETLSKGIPYPPDVRADAQALYNKWLNGDFDAHLLRGVQVRQGKNEKGQSFRSYSIEKGWKRLSCNYHGARSLTNGQWWPLQICAVRDGAHGEIEAGIHGEKDKGAYSIVMSGGGYSNVDNGDTIQYCGTSGLLGIPSTGTKYLLDSHRLQQPIRVLRSSSSDKVYHPIKGIRYDGIYLIDDYEILDAGTAMHRFNMSRVADQDEIRYKDEGKRPSTEELAAFGKIKELLGKST